MTTHAKLSPSKRHRWGVCPASVREEAKYPEDRSGTAAIDGTHTHTLLEWAVTHDDCADPLAKVIGTTMKDDDGEFVVDADRAERVKFALDYIRKQAVGNVKVISEDQVDPFPLTMRFDLSGHVDIQIVSHDTLEVIDYKDGMSGVTAVENHQLEQYAFGCLCAHQDCDFKTIRMTIIQPKLRSKGQSGITSWEISYDELMARLPALIEQAAATDDPNAPFNPGDAQCKYCRAKGGCSALTTSALTSAGISFDNLSGAAAETDPATLSDDRIREIMEAAPLIRQMLEGVEIEALRRLEDGKEIRGLKLVKGRGSRGWAFPDDVIAEKLTKMGLPKSVLWETKIISPAKVEKVKWKNRAGDDKSLSDKQRALIHSEYIKKSDGKLTVALESDDRPAVTINVASMFGAISDLPDFLKGVPNV